MQKFNSLIKEELSGWKPFDVIWLVFVCVTITVISIFFKIDTNDNYYWTRIIASACGIINVVLGGKGKLSNYAFGFIHCVLMIYITFDTKLYADMSVTIYNFVMQFIGFFTWSKNMNKETHEVKKIHMKKSTRLIYLAIIAVGTVVLGLVMRQTGDSAPFADAAKAVMQILAMIMMVKMFSEQWWIWLAINIISIFMYVKVEFFTPDGGRGNLPIILMYVVYLVNSIIMCARWEKEARENDRLMEKIEKQQPWKTK